MSDIPPPKPPSTDRAACLQWFKDWTTFGLNHSGFQSDWFNSDDDTQEFFGLTHHEFLIVRLFQRVLKLENAVDSMIFPNQDQ